MNKQLFDEIRTKRNVSLEKLSEMTEIPLSTLMKISSGKIQTSFQNMCRIAKALECSLDDFTDIQYPSLTADDRHLVQQFHSLSRHNQNAIQMILDMEQQPVDTAYGPARPIPCHIPIFYQGDFFFQGCYNTTTILLPMIDRYPEADFGWKIPNDAYTPSFLRSDLLLFQYRYPAAEEVALFQQGDQLSIRRYVVCDHTPMLQSVNFDHRPLQPVPKKKCRCLGTLHSIIRADSPLAQRIDL